MDDEEPNAPETKQRRDADDRRTEREANEERRRVMRDMLYRKDS